MLIVHKFAFTKQCPHLQEMHQATCIGGTMQLLFIFLGVASAALGFILLDEYL